MCEIITKYLIPFYNFAKKNMEQDELKIVREALIEANYLISNEIQSVIDEDVYREYKTVLNKIDGALQIVIRCQITP